MNKATFLIILSIFILLLSGTQSINAVIVTKGDSVLKTDIVRDKYGIDGYGVKVGVISDGVDSLPLIQQMGELPPDVTVLSNRNDGDEGTMMLQIIHDIAPGAQLYFHDSGVSSKDFNAAVDALLRAGCQIICDDVSWIIDPVYEDGITATHIQNILQKNRSFIEVSSAGNFALQHYRAKYYKGENNFHDFSLGKSRSKDIYLDVPNMEKVIAVLKWDEQTGTSREDYDLYLTRVSDGEVLQSGEIRQNGTGKALEYIRWINMDPETQRVAVRIENHDGKASPKELDLLLIVTSGINILPINIVPDHSVFGHTGSPDVISVAAVPAEKTNKIEPFSSAGTVNILFPENETRNKPDITGPDEVYVLDGSGEPLLFSGTSAAAPHVAGVLALLWSAFPGRDAKYIRESIIKTATDLGPKGWDPRYGNGLVNALSAIQSLGTLETSTSRAQRIGLTPDTIVMKNGSIKGEYYPDGSFKITGPVIINKPGTYRLSRDILQSGKRYTLLINSSDVTLDGDGHVIEGVILGDAKPKMQVGLNINGMYRVIRNITIKNMNFEDFDWSIFMGLVRDVTIENCSFSNNFGGVFNYQGENVLLKKGTFTGNEYGVYEFGAKDLSILSNTFRSNKEAVTIYSPDKGLIAQNNFIMNTKHGAFVIDASPIDIVDNSFLGNMAFGLSLVNVSGMNVTNNIFVENWNSISIVDSSKPLLAGNLISENSGTGIGIIDSKALVMRENKIQKNGFGIALSGSNENSIRANDITQNKVGILLENSTDNRMEDNLLKNEKNIVVTPPDFENYLNGTLFSGPELNMTT